MCYVCLLMLIYSLMLLMMLLLMMNLFSATMCLRFVLFPLVVQVQRNVATMNNHNPEMMRLQQKVSKVLSAEQSFTTYRAKSET